MPKRRKKKGRPVRRQELDMFDQTANVARRAYRGVQYLRSVLNPELKYLTLTGSITPGTTCSIVNMTAIAEGSTQITRNGVSIKAHDWEISCSVALDTANSVSVDIVRFIVVVDLQAKAALMTAAQYFTTATDPLSLRNDEEISRFVVLHDSTHSLSTGTKPLATHKCAGLWPGHVKYLGDTSGTAHVGNGQLMFLVLAKENTHPSTVVYSTRVHFYDN